MVAVGAAPDDSGQTVFSDRVTQTMVTGYRFG